MSIRGIRGAVQAERDEPEAILAATRELIAAIMAANPGLDPADVASVFFTVTDDLSAIHPALGARQLGWTDVPLMCAREIPVPGSLPRCIRVLVHWNTELPQSAVHPVYLGEASVLRPDLAAARPGK
ncbi:MAG TPA: chorismate mutase [Anaerolinea sp.]|mgnify:CR=1 FL=1|nr:chorismate mutase [Anaerolinea sp.]